MPSPLTIGLPRMHKEAGERRDFLLSFVGHLEKLAVQVGIGLRVFWHFGLKHYAGASV